MNTTHDFTPLPGAAQHSMTIADLHKDYQSGVRTPDGVFADIRARAKIAEDHTIFLHLLTEEEISPYLDALKQKPIETHPLWGVPFAIKDNIDLAGIPTTAGCEPFTYKPDDSACVVQQLIDAGAIPVGKTNLDQFATGLNGTRSFAGPCRNSFNKDYVSGGSSSGSAVAVGLGLATFSLGTDTAGSGRVPACFNNLIGVKPTIGLLSATGMVAACRTLDCISIFAFNSDDANVVLSAAEGFDIRDGYSRKNPFQNQARQYGRRQGALTIGVIPNDQLDFFGSTEYQAAYNATLETLKADGHTLIEIDYAPFDEAAKLLYEGPWVSERFIATEQMLQTNPESVFPVVRTIVEQGRTPKATELFKAQYRLNDLNQLCKAQMESLDCLLTPTAGRHFTIEEVLEEPILRNSQLGFYTNFMNLLDMASVAVPTQITHQMPFGVTVVGPAFSDRQLLSIANRIQTLFLLPQGATGIANPTLSNQEVGDLDSVELLVCGAHLSGQPLNWQLTERGATLLQSTTTSPSYRLYALAGGPPLRPALVNSETQGQAIDVEVWKIPTAQLGSFVAGIPAPLGIGKVELADGRWVSGFICEPAGLKDSKEITHLGGWRAYLASLEK